MSGQATAIGQIEGGPRWALIGDPTIAAGAGMVSIGRVPSVSRSPNLMRQLVKNEVGQTLKIYGNLMDYNIEIEMQKNSAAILAAMVTEFTDQTTSISMGTSFDEITGQTLCLVDDDTFKNGTPLTALTTEWFTSVSSSALGALVNQIVNGDDQPTYTVSFLAQFVLSDQLSQAFTADYEIAFRGSPVDAIAAGTPTAWTLPAVGTW